MAGENITDIIVIGIIILSGLFALARGLVKELLSIAGWVVAVFVTLYGFLPLRWIARDIITWQLAADIVTGATLFLGSLFIFSFASHFVAKAVQDSAAGALDRSLGFVFGLVRGLLIVIVLYMATSWAIGERDQPNWFRNARSVPIVATGAKLVLALVPEDMRKLFPPVVRPEGRTSAPAATNTAQREGYRATERRDMQRLIEGTQ
jgi:membrane protein required for colicin V production